MRPYIAGLYLYSQRPFLWYLLPIVSKGFPGQSGSCVNYARDPTLAFSELDAVPVPAIVKASLSVTSLIPAGNPLDSTAVKA